MEIKSCLIIFCTDVPRCERGHDAFSLPGASGSMYISGMYLITFSEPCMLHAILEGSVKKM